MENNLKKGDWVEVMDEGLLMLQRFAPKNAKPNNHGRIVDFLEDGDVEIEFPIGDDNIDEHSQSSIYDIKLLRKLK